ncbi:uncharacterized protein SPAPADRAFT_157531 [Spathaspora passalidarum NRRL Y-27907]|uniref:Peptidase A1 domain-containing protein n=1 Tax=Spathaspora passalidarum (strain NRRL Y-27907 / 11-Y1) TaxID=619300 RepID=G3AU86_SPAPN|nr:uncharacterized protein SPAPADRAFT_157531 [Spathaspora passalidarum NRRL Y-27907]EGW30462.1 hypothetical protein SPAPADRAFT_157531 [Spathaspora passalidarum NRRL Y-27907]
MLHLFYIFQYVLAVGAMSTGGVHRLDFEVVTRDSSAQPEPLMKQNMLNDKNMYLARFFIGSNRDEVKLQVDTSCADFWVMGSGVDCLPHIPRRAQYDIWTRCSCEDIAAPTQMVESSCISQGSFRFNDSTTFERHDKEYYQENHLTRGKTAQGFWGLDDVSFANKSIRIPFGVVNETNLDEGILGLGFPEENGNLSFPYELKKNGLIDRAAYSLYFNSTNASFGSLLFGGIDHAKYSGNLKSIAAVHNQTISYIAVDVNRILMTMNNTTTVVIGNKKTTFMLDTSSSLSRFPMAVLNTMADALGGRVYKETNDLIVQRCPDTLEFNIDFDGQLISIPGEAFMYKSIGDHCLIRIQVDDLTPAIGQDLLRSMYVVVDLEQEEVSVAEAKFTQDYEIELLPPVGKNRSYSVEFTGTEREESASHSNSVEILIAGLMWLALLVVI